MSEFRCSPSEIYGVPPPERSHELRTIDHPLGQVAVWGHCFADDAALQSAAFKAAEANNLQPLQELPGAYTAALLNDEGLQVVADRTNQFSLYHGEVNGHTIVTSRPSEVVEGGVKPDPLGVAAYIFAPDLAGALEHTRSTISGFTRLMPGHLLHATSQRTQVALSDTLTPNPHKTMDEAAAELRAALQAAIAQRYDLGVSLTSDMSGGKDSSTLAFLAAQEGEARGQMVHSFMAYHPDFFDGDQKYAKLFATLHPNLDLETVSYAGDTPDYYEGHNVPHGEDPAHQFTAKTLANMYEYFGRIAQAGGRLHMKGHGGDEVLEAHPLYLADLFRTRQLGAFMRQGLAAARLGKVSPRETWQKAATAALTTPSQWMNNFAHALEHPSDEPFAWVNNLQLITPPTRDAHWLTTQMRNEMADFARSHANDFTLPEGQGYADYMAWRSVQASGANAMRTQHYLDALGYGIGLHVPFLDRHVVDACLSMPSYNRVDHQNFKLLLTKALKGVIPDEVLARRSKGDYTRMTFDGLQQAAPHFRRMLKDSRLADLGIIEPRAVLEALDRAPLTYGFPMWAMGRIVCAELWLQGLDAPRSNRASTPKPPPVAQLSIDRTTEATMPSGQYAAPSHVYATARQDGSLMVLNLKTDKYIPLNATLSHIFRVLAATGSAEQCVESLHAAYPQESLHRLRRDVRQGFQDLVGKGIIREADESFTPRTFPHSSTPQSIEDAEAYSVLPREQARGKWVDKVLAFAGLGIGTVLDRRAPQARLSALQLLHEKWCTRDATKEEATTFLEATHAVGRFWIGRLACQEEAFTTALALAIKRRKVEWHRGVEFDPLQFHSWINAKGEPVRTARMGSAEGYRSFFE